MSHSSSGLADAFDIALGMARDLKTEGLGLVGYGVVEVTGEDGAVKSLTPFANLITDTGDAYYAAKAVAAVPPAALAAPTALTGMQIGSGSTAVSKSGAGSAIVTLLAGQAFDATYPQVANLGGGLGVNAVYRTTFAAGVGTGTVQEATVTTGTVGTASTAANTVARVVFASVAKAAGDSLAITWNHKFLGA